MILTMCVDRAELRKRAKHGVKENSEPRKPVPTSCGNAAQPDILWHKAGVHHRGTCFHSSSVNDAAGFPAALIILPAAT